MKKNSMKKIFAIFFATTTVFSVSACNSGDQGYVVAKAHRAPSEVYALTFDDAIGEDVMPVGSYAGPNNKEREYKGQTLPSMVSKEYFDLYKEMGLNFFTATHGVKSKTEIEEFLTLCDEYDMGAFLTFSELNGPEVAPYVTSSIVENCLGKYSDYKSLLGFYLRDEPTTAMIDKLENTMNSLKESVHANTMYAYGNAFPDYATPAGYDQAGSVMSWEEYLDKYCKQLDLGYLSFDFYPWYIKSDGTEYYNSGYIKALSVARKVANKYKIPVWSCKQCGSVFESLPMELQKITPTEDKFRWQMTVDLAYGVKGFTYFLLCGEALAYDTNKDADGNPIWQEGMDDYFGIFNGYTGKPNVWFDYAKEFDVHLTNVEKILMNSYHDGVIANGPVIEKNNMGEEWIKSGTYYELAKVSGATSLIGCYNYEGQTVLYVTNNSYTKNGTVTLTFDDKYGYDVYQGADNKFEQGKELTLDLLPGEGALVKLKYE